MFKVALNSKGTEATLFYSDRIFTLTADTHGELLDLLAMFLQPLETWNGEFATYTTLNASAETTAVIELKKVA